MWSKNSLKVDFPAHGEQRYAIQGIHLPPDDKVDLALLELKEPLEFAQPVTLEARLLSEGAQIRFGGYGNYGAADKIVGTNRFHWGTNKFDSANPEVAKFSMGKPATDEAREALPGLMDSGCPIFVVDGKQEVLAGVAVLVSNRGSPDVGDRATIKCLTDQVEWIKQIASDLKWRE